MAKDIEHFFISFFFYISFFNNQLVRCSGMYLKSITCSLEFDAGGLTFQSEVQLYNACKAILSSQRVKAGFV